MSGIFEIHASPAPFDEAHERAQLNALQSWVDLPNTLVELFGEEVRTIEGTPAEAIPFSYNYDVERIGTMPLLRELLVPVNDQHEDDVYAYINADIILQPTFREAVRIAAVRFDTFLLVAQRINVDIGFDTTTGEGWQRMIELTNAEGELQPPYSLDVFVYRGDVWGDVPDFVIGRKVFDNWLVGRALQRGVSVIDATAFSPVIHHGEGRQIREFAPGDRHNRSLVVANEEQMHPVDWWNDDITGGVIKTIADSTYVLTAEGEIVPRARRHREGVYVSTPFAAPPSPRWWMERERVMMWAAQNDMPMDFTVVNSKNSVAFNHNEAIRDFLASSYEWMLMLDADAVIHPLTVSRLMSWGKQAIVPLFVRASPPYTPTIYTRLEDGHANPNMCHQDFDWLRTWCADNIEQLAEIDAPVVMASGRGEALQPIVRAGTHTMLVHRDVLDAIEPPWFEATGDSGAGSDMDFCRKIAEAGIQLWCDKTVVSGHLQGEYCVGLLDWLAWDGITRYDSGGGFEIHAGVRREED